MGAQPIAHVLLVVAWLNLALLIGVRPETARIGREALVDERNLAVDDTELELRIGNDDAARGRILGGGGVDLQRQIANLLGNLSTRVPVRSNEMFSSWSPMAALVDG